MADEEFATIADGAMLNGALTIGAVILILWLALRSSRIILAVMLSLIVGLTITAAAGLAMVGALNLISVAFAVLFVGIGVDFGIQFSVRYRRGAAHQSTISARRCCAAAAEVGKPLALAAAATAAGFYAFVPTDYHGVSELGLIAGTGMLIAFATSVTLLPALLMLLKPPGEAHEVGYRTLVPVDRFLARHRRAILVLTGLAVVAGLPLLQHLRFDFNPLNLRSAKVESVATMLDLMKGSGDLARHHRRSYAVTGRCIVIARRLEQLPEVAHATTLRTFVPGSSAREARDHRRRCKPAWADTRSERGENGTDGCGDRASAHGSERCIRGCTWQRVVGGSFLAHGKRAHVSRDHRS